MRLRKPSPAMVVALIALVMSSTGSAIAAIDYASEGRPNVNPYDIGLGHAIKLDHEFTGKSGIEATAANPPNAYVTLKVEGDDETEYEAEVKKDGEVVGVAPSPTVSPGFGAITLATVYDAPPYMGPAYWIPAFWVPALLVTHYVTFLVLLETRKGNR